MRGADLVDEFGERFPPGEGLDRVGNGDTVLLGHQGGEILQLRRSELPIGLLSAAQHERGHDIVA